jgi:hypothetical protein
MPPAEYFDILFLGSGQRSKQPRSAAVECAAALCRWHQSRSLHGVNKEKLDGSTRYLS